jgi:hypothetical protein
MFVQKKVKKNGSTHPQIANRNSQFARQISFIRCVTVASGTWCRWLCSVFALDEDQ